MSEPEHCRGEIALFFFIICEVEVAGSAFLKIVDDDYMLCASQNMLALVHNVQLKYIEK